MSLFSALSSTSSALSAFEQALTVTQNNVNNASTPGYTRQTQTLQALPFEEGTGETGGVVAGSISDSRDVYAEQNVRDTNSQLGTYEQQVESLTNLQSQFDISGDTGIPAALNSLFSAFSAWSATPGDNSARVNVLTTAGNVASAFQNTATSLGQISANTDQQTNALVTQVNQLAGQLSGYNARIQSGDQHDPALEAAMNSALETLSEIAPVTSIKGSDGSVSVLLGGQSSLVSGSTANLLSVSVNVPSSPVPANPAGPPTAHLLDANGRDITNVISGGKLGAVLDVRNRVLPAIQGDSTQPGALNQLAQAFADRVNNLLTSGNISDGPPPVPGVPLFSYDAMNPANAAASLQVSSAMTPGQLAASDPGPPAESNGIALKLSGLVNSTNAADQINGQTYTQYFGSIASNVGSQLASAKNGQNLQNSLLTQAKSIRQQLSGVDLNEAAAQIMQYQQAYQAAAKMVSVVDSLTQSVLGMISGSAG